MARKSRKGSGLELPKSNELPQKWKVGIYGRLSNQNAGHEDDQSLVSQVEYVKEHLKNIAGLVITDVYTDNGYTGTNFMRPSFVRLMDDLKCGRINCIAVKDLSRFGRNYLETGYYLEKVFPFMNVRFISINDGYDNLKNNEGISVPIKSILNEMYSRDLSQKVRTAFRTKREQGKLLSSVPFGYTKDKEGNIFVDEPMRKYVELVFELCLSGKSYSDIANELTNQGVPLPFERRMELGLLNRKKEQVRTKWNTTDVKRILGNPIYTGDMVYSQIEYTGNYVNTGNIKPKDEWQIIKDTHEAIISHDDFDAAYKVLQNSLEERDKKRIRKQKEQELMPDIFKGYMFCSKCNKGLSFKRFFNGDKPLYGKYYCRCTGNSSSKLTDNKLRGIIFNQLHMQLKLSGDFEKLVSSNSIKSKIRMIKDKLTKEMETQSVVVEKINVKRHNIYLDFVDGMLCKDEYLFFKEKQDTELKKTMSELKLLEDRLSELDNLFKENVLIEKLRMYLNENVAPIEDILKLFIKRIEYDSKESVNITFTFDDYFIKLLKVEEITK